MPATTRALLAFRGHVRVVATCSSAAALQVRQLEQSATTAKFQAALAPTVAAPSVAPSADATAASASFLPTLPSLPDWMPSLPRRRRCRKKVADAAAIVRVVSAAAVAAAAAAAAVGAARRRRRRRLAPAVAADAACGAGDARRQRSPLRHGADGQGRRAPARRVRAGGARRRDRRRGDRRQGAVRAGDDDVQPACGGRFLRRAAAARAKRLLSLSYLTASFTTGLLWDWLVLGKLLKDDEFKALKAAEPERAKEALRLCEVLGPTFIKLGQALSIRTDLVPEAYALELRQLQDAVPPFPTEEAFDVIRKQLGLRDISQTFATLSASPVASASIGQVYKGVLKDEAGTTVAVKVQRPGILAEIALDLYVLRLITPVQTFFQNAVNGLSTTQEDIDVAIQLVDEWGRGFVAETDYRLEAKNTQEFGASMKARGLEAVCAPAVVEELVRDTVLVTEWVEGTRLDRDASPDVPRLCGVAINAYLTMLLDTGVLHCDPHPGNLLRTTDGKLCILDWGMTLAVPPDLQYALLEFIAHLNVEDYESVPQDFVNMGFSPEGVDADRLKRSGITDGLSFAFRQLSAGGGPKKIAERVEVELKERYGTELSGRELEKKAQEEFVSMAEAQLAAEGVDVKGVTNVMEEMSRRNRELLRVASVGALCRSRLLDPRGDHALYRRGLRDRAGVHVHRPPPLHRPLAARQDGPPRDARSRRRRRADGVGWGHDGRLAPALPAAGGAMDGVVVPTAAAGGGLSPAKLVEMSEQFRTATAATADVDAGAGQAEAARELAKLLVAPEGSAARHPRRRERGKLGDATVRSALRAALIDAPSTLAAPLGLAPPAALAQLLARFERRRGNPRARRRAPRSRRPAGDRGARPRRHRRRRAAAAGRRRRVGLLLLPTRPLATTRSRASRASASSRAARRRRDAPPLGHPLRRRLRTPGRGARRGARRDLEGARRGPRPAGRRLSPGLILFVSAG